MFTRPIISHSDALYSLQIGASRSSVDKLGREKGGKNGKRSYRFSPLHPHSIFCPCRSIPSPGPHLLNGLNVVYPLRLVLCLIWPLAVKVLYFGLRISLSSLSPLPLLHRLMSCESLALMLLWIVHGEKKNTPPTRRSHPRAISIPPPNAYPSTTPILGT